MLWFFATPVCWSTAGPIAGLAPLEGSGVVVSSGGWCGGDR